MPEKRRHRRYRRRFLMKFGVKELDQSGYTMDLSAGGAFVAASREVPLGQRIHLQVYLDQHRFLFFEGEVRRKKVVPLELRALERGGFGVRFLSPGELAAEALGLADRYELRYATKAELAAAYQRELRLGGVFLVTSKLLPRESKVYLDLCLDFVNEAIDVESTVVYVADGSSPGGAQGIGLTFNDRPALEAKLRPFLEKPTPSP